VSVTVCASDCAPAAVGGKLSDVALRESVATAWPIPLSAIVCVPASSTIVSVPVADPACVGAKASWIWQLYCAGSVVVPHELVTMTNGPEIDRLLIDTAVVPLFTACAGKTGDLDPTAVDPKSRLDGDRITLSGGSPFPARLTFSWPPVTFALTTTSPVKLPVLLGANLTWMLQLAAGATSAPVQSSLFVKSPLT